MIRSAISLVLIVLPSLVTAQYTPPISQTSFDARATTSTVLATQADLTLYVDPTGSDANDCTSSGTAACLTIEGARAKLSAKRLRHNVVINLAAGTYTTGASLEGYSCETGVQPTVGAKLQIVGVLANVTPTTGAATGTATSATAQSGTTFATLVDSGAVWTVNDFAKKAELVITSGTGSGQIFAIESNTATALSIAGAWITQPDATSHYAIQTPSVTVGSGQTLPIGPNNTEYGQSAAVTNYAAFIIDGIRGGATAPNGGFFTSSVSGEQSCVLIDKIKFSGRGVAIRNSIGVAVRFSQFTGTATSAVELWDGSFVKTQSNIQTGVLAANVPFHALWGQQGLPSYLLMNGNAGTGGQLIEGSASGTVGGLGGIYGRSNSWASCNASSNGCFHVAGSMEVYSRFDKFTSPTGPGYNIGVANSGFGTPGSFFGNSITVSSGSTDGVIIKGPWIVSDSGGFTGTGNAGFGMRLGNGVRMRFTASDTITGTAGDLVMDNRTMTWADATTIVSTGLRGLMTATGSLLATAGSNPGSFDSLVMLKPEATIAASNCTVSNKGSMYLDTTLNQLTVCDANAAWSAVNTAGSFVDHAGTAGDQTINAETFRFDIAAAGTQAVITNSEVVAASVILCQLQTSDATCTGVRRATPAAGNVTVVMVAACTAQATVGCSVLH